MKDPHSKLSRLLPALPLVLSLGFGLLAACSSTPSEPDPVWTQAKLEGANDRIAWKLALRACDKLGFPIAASIDQSAMAFETGWLTDLQPFRGDGTRKKAVVKMDPLPDGSWEIRARVKTQRNMSITRPLDIRYADWEWTDDDTAMARLLVQHIRSYLNPLIDPVDRPDDPVQAALESHGLGK